MKALVLKRLFIVLLATAIALSFWLSAGFGRNAAIGAAIGGVLGFSTNWLVIWMLFHPRQPYKAPLWLGGNYLPMTPGLIVEKQVELAESIGRTVSTKLINAESIQKELGSAETEAAITSYLRCNVLSVLQKDLPPVAELLDRDALLTVLKAKPRLVNAVTLGIFKQISTPEFHDSIVVMCNREIDKISRKPIKTWFNTLHRQKLATWCTEQMRNYIEGSAGRRFVEHACRSMESKIANGTNDTIDDLRVFAEEFAVSQIPRFIDESLGSIKKRFNGSEMDENLRGKITVEIESAIKEAIPSELPHSVIIQGLVGDFSATHIRSRVDHSWDKLKCQLFDSAETRRFVVAEAQATIERIFEGMTQGGEASNYKIREMTLMLSEHASRRITDAIDYQTVEDLIYQSLDTWTSRSLDDILPNWKTHINHHIDQLISRALASLSERERAPLDRLVDDLFDKLLFDTRLGHPIRLIPNGDREDLVAAVARRGYNLILDAGPQLAEQVSIEKIVKEQIIGFNPEQIEMTIRDVADRELGAIVVFGGFLGVVGGALLQPLLLSLCSMILLT